jgi:ascorbate PTS system EIIC component
MEFINYLASNFFKQPPIFLGLIAMVGLIIQKKSINDILKGTLKNYNWSNNSFQRCWNN